MALLGRSSGHTAGQLMDGHSTTERQRTHGFQDAKTSRIIEASTNPGDVVLDLFCGCRTAVVAAQMLKRKFVGIDISLFSVETVTYNRLQNEARMLKEEIKILDIPEDFEITKRLAHDDPFAFEIFAVEACHPGMVANKVQRGDKGIDERGMLLHPVKENGKKKQLILAQVKIDPKPEHVDAFANVIRNTKGSVAGVFIALDRKWEGCKKTIAEAEEMFNHEHSAEEFPRLQPLDRRAMVLQDAAFEASPFAGVGKSFGWLAKIW